MSKSAFFEIIQNYVLLKSYNKGIEEKQKINRIIKSLLIKKHTNHVLDDHC